MIAQKTRLQGLAIRNTDTTGPANALTRALLVQVLLPGGPADDDLEELHLLAASAGAEVCGTILGRRNKPEPALFVGKGKAVEIRDRVRDADAELVLFNHELTPIQERNLEKELHCRVLDRTGLILDIFALRAHSHEGKLQVELAQLERLATRLVRGWTHLERQKGGIGLRGPGETQLETDRRLIRGRLRRLERQLRKVRTQRGLRRKTRNKVPIPTVSLIGYTNAGKSSLFNCLTGAAVYEADQLFATLDPTMRRLDLAGNVQLILADTVGFIRRLPHGLVEAFKSTLEEVTLADLLLHVVDGGNPERIDCMRQVGEVLEEINAENVAQIVVFNKIDITGEPPRVERDTAGRIIKVWLSAKTGAGVDLLRLALLEHYRRHRRYRRLCLPPAAGRLRAHVYAKLEVLRESPVEGGGWILELALDETNLGWLQRQDDFRDKYLDTPTACELAPIAS